MHLQKNNLDPQLAKLPLNCNHDLYYSGRLHVSYMYSLMYTEAR